ncbi:MAG: caspase family protein [Muribaculaceae bacterium]|nr:caspase family protein [Muribaculaceae bacterium]
MRNFLFVILAAIVMSAMAVSCGNDGSNGSNKDGDNSAANERGTKASDSSEVLDDSIGIDTTGIETPMDSGFQKSTKKAMLIGVSTYKDKSWESISSGNDIDMLEKTLTKELGFEVVLRTESRATHQGIVNAFVELTNKCNPGDTVLVHFSGHGQQMVDQEGDETDDHLTECFIPYDAYMKCSTDPNGYRGQCHFTDDEMHKYIANLRKKLGKNGFLLVTLDACHSGSLSRESDSENKVMRGTNDYFGYGILKQAKVKPRFVTGDVNYARYVVVSACQPDEINYEVSRNGKNYGSLSFILNEKLLDVKSGKLTIDKLPTAIKGERSYWSEQGQTPYIDNNDENVQ